MSLIPLRWSGLVLVALVTAGCSRHNENSFKITGSDTMVNLSEAWAEKFGASHPDVIASVKGGGSGVGIAALCSGKIEIATSSRPMKPKEIALARHKTGKEPKQYVVGRDALAIYVHPGNPLETISIEQLAEIYGQDGTITRWEHLDVQNTACKDGEIIRVARQNSSGTYAYFKEAVLGDNREYKQGSTAQSGSRDVVDLVSKTPCSIGYSGMGYRDGTVKVVRVSKKKGEPAIEPTVETALDGSYPISRPLYIYTLGEPAGVVLEFVQWALSDEGQKIVEEQGYVPNPTEQKAP